MQAAIIRDDFFMMHTILNSRGCDLKVYSMDNECSSDLKQFMETYAIDFQLSPPHTHRRNAAERAVRT